MLEQTAVPAAAGAATLAATLAARGVLFRLLARAAAKTASRLDDIAVDALRRPSLFWCAALALEVGIAVSDLPERRVAPAHKAIEVLLVLSVTFAAAGIAGRLFDSYLEEKSLPGPGTGLVQGVLKGTIYAVGLLVALSVLGISIAPIITALGVGGLAVALALQDTLANLFAGIHILLEKPFRVGDFVRLESGQEGQVVDITWRTTRIRTLQNNLVVLPNGKLAQSTLTNYSLPDGRSVVTVPFSVPYDADVPAVERMVLQEAAAAADGGTILRDPAPSVRLAPGFGTSALELTLLLHLPSFADAPAVQDGVRRRILSRFRAEGIEIPYPHQVVHLSDGTPARPAAG
jgi:small-conductance mechanosensitive channel